MLGRRVMLTPKGFEVSFLVSRMASRKASGEGWVRAVRTPEELGIRCLSREGNELNAPRPPASDTAATSFGTPTLDIKNTVRFNPTRFDLCAPLHSSLDDRTTKT